MVKIPDSIEEFLRLKGSVEMICEIGDRGARFSQLNDNITWVSKDTLLKRFEQGKQINVFSVEARDRGSSNVNYYVLSNIGWRIWKEFEDRGIIETYNRKKSYIHEFDEEKESVIDWMSRSEEMIIKERREAEPMPPLDEEDSNSTQ